MDSEESDTDEGIQRFRQQYEIETVPALLYFKRDGEVCHLMTNTSSDSFSKETLELQLKSYMNGGEG